MWCGWEIERRKILWTDVGLQTVFTHLLPLLLLSVTLLLWGFPSNLYTYYHILFSFSPVNLEAREIDRKGGLKGTAPSSSAIRSENPATSCFSIVILICDVVLKYCCISCTFPTLNVWASNFQLPFPVQHPCKNNTGQPNPLTFLQCSRQPQTELRHCTSQQLPERYKVTLVTCHTNRNSPKIQCL